MVRYQASKKASKQESKQASKKTDFTVDLTWWGSLRLAPIISTLKHSKYLVISQYLDSIVHLKSPGIRVRTRSQIAHASLVNLQVTNECKAQVHERVKQQYASSRASKATSECNTQVHERVKRV